MFNKDFYPTPSNVIERMLMDVDVQGKVILEPSAGKGNIVDYLQQHGAKEVIACENETILAKIVGSKCRLIANDFLTLKSDDISHVDMIVMNPPFSQDDKHILHAWDIAPAGCEIIALCNMQTLENTYTQSRKVLLETITNNGCYDDFGMCFSNAERSTNVYVACVYLTKPGKADDEFAGYFDFEPEMEQTQQEGIVRYNYVRDVVSRYVQAVKMFDGVMAASNEINALTAPISKHRIKFGAYVAGERNYTTVTRDFYKKELQKGCWHKVLEDMQMDKFVTKGVRSTINNFVEKQIHVPFTVKNVYKMIEMIIGTHPDRMNKTIIEAFELICSYSADNNTAGETWKTNSNYMLNKRFIVPFVCECNYSWQQQYVGISHYRVRDEIGDIIKVLCFLTGTDYNSVQSLYDFTTNTTNLQPLQRDEYVRMEWGKWYEWQPFFRIRGYKKGTMHFEFLDEDVWAAFNRKVAEIKGWRLPNNIKKRRKTK